MPRKHRGDFFGWLRVSILWKSFSEVFFYFSTEIGGGRDANFFFSIKGFSGFFLVAMSFQCNFFTLEVGTVSDLAKH